MRENPGYCNGGFDGLHLPSDDDDDDMVDIAGATLDFSSTDDVPPLSSGQFTHTHGVIMVPPGVCVFVFNSWGIMSLFAGPES